MTEIRTDEFVADLLDLTAADARGIQEPIRPAD